MAKYTITTIDNPFDPIEDFDSWYNFDMDKGYNTCAYLARLVFTSDSLSEAENDRAVEMAIDDIIRYDFMNIYRKVKVPEEADTIPVADENDPSR